MHTHPSPQVHAREAASQPIQIRRRSEEEQEQDYQQQLRDKEDIAPLDRSNSNSSRGGGGESREFIPKVPAGMRFQQVTGRRNRG